MSSPVDSPANLFPMQENGGGETTTVISGRKCSALLTKSGPLGLSVRTLLASPLWSKEGYSLTWGAIPLYSRKVTSFTDTNSKEPSPSNASAEILSDSDIPSSRSLFRLRVSALPTDGTASSSLPLMQTPTVVMTCENPVSFRARAERNQYRNGTKYGSLESQIKYDPRFAEMLPAEAARGVLLPTPRAAKNVGLPLTEGIAERNKGNLEEAVASMLLPTPTAGEAEKYRLKYTPGSQMGTSLSALAASPMLPTPTCNDATNQSLPPSQEERNDSIVKRVLNGSIPSDLTRGEDGPAFRLSPLFAEEMMGFPSLWTTLPFLKQDGEPSPSRPTETPSCPK